MKLSRKIISGLLAASFAVAAFTGCTSYETGDEKVYSYDEAVTELEAFNKEIKTDTKTPVMDIYDDETTNKALADKYGMKCWTNAETFDRDMPISFLPIKFDKLRLKLEAAKRCGYDKAITFEFSHFMSPQSAYVQAGHLYDRYKEYFNIK